MLVYQYPSDIQCYEHNGLMCNVGHDKVSLDVTLDHNLYLKIHHVCIWLLCTIF